jgi:hypothetical protein
MTRPLNAGFDHPAAYWLEGIPLTLLRIVERWSWQPTP